MCRNITFGIGIVGAMALLLLGAACTAPQTESAPTLTPAPLIGQALVKQVEVLTIQSFPVQVSLVVKGELLDGCAQLGEVVQTREGNEFRITITTTR